MLGKRNKANPKKTGNLNTYIRIFTAYMAENGLEPESKKLDDRIAALLAAKGWQPPPRVLSSRRLMMQWLCSMLRPVTFSCQPPCSEKIADVTPRSVDEGLAFYRTPEWKRARIDALIRLGRRCGCCGASPETGAVLNVDHIKPLRFNWHLRLAQNNLQILCADCNEGKGNRLEVDFRPAA